MAKSLKDLLGEKKNPYLRSKADQKFAADFTSDTTIKKDRATEHEGNFKALGVKSVENEKERHGFDTPDDNADGTDLDPGTFKNLDDRLKKYKKYTNIAEGGKTFPKDGKAHIDRLAKKHGLDEGFLTKMRRFLDKVSGNQQERILKKSRARQDAGPFGGHKKEGDTVRSSLKNYYRGTDTERVGKRYMSGGKKDGGPLFYHSKNGKKTPIYEEDLNEASKAELLSRYASQVKEVMVEISGLLNDYVKHQKNGYYIDFYNIKSNLSQLMDIRDSLTGSVESAEKDAEQRCEAKAEVAGYPR